METFHFSFDEPYGFQDLLFFLAFFILEDFLSTLLCNSSVNHRMKDRTKVALLELLQLHSICSISRRFALWNCLVCFKLSWFLFHNQKTPLFSSLEAYTPRFLFTEYWVQLPYHCSQLFCSPYLSNQLALTFSTCTSLLTIFSNLPYFHWVLLLQFLFMKNLCLFQMQNLKIHF